MSKDKTKETTPEEKDLAQAQFFLEKYNKLVEQCGCYLKPQISPDGPVLAPTINERKDIKDITINLDADEIKTA